MGHERACCHPYPSRMDAGTKPDADGAGQARDGARRGPREPHDGPDLSDLLWSEITRVAEGYRRMPHSKFALRLEPFGSRAQAGHWLAGQYAVLAQGVEQWDRILPPVWHRLPVLGVFALGDQIAVTGRDLVEAYRALKDPAETSVWTLGEGRVPAEKAMAAVLESTTALRKKL